MDLLKRRMSEIKKQKVRQKTQIRENVWYKLYLLQNYKITPDMFHGSNYRWKSIQTYQSAIRLIYNGIVTEPKLQNGGNYCSALIDYIHGLMDSGLEPYPLFGNKKGKNLVSIQFLLDNGLLTKHEIEQIYENVGDTGLEPDFSISGSRCTSCRTSTNTTHGSYVELITNPIQQTSINPVEKKDLINPGKSQGILDSIKSIFFLIPGCISK